MVEMKTSEALLRMVKKSIKDADLNTGVYTGVFSSGTPHEQVKSSLSRIERYFASWRKPSAELNLVRTILGKWDEETIDKKTEEVSVSPNVVSETQHGDYEGWET